MNVNSINLHGRNAVVTGGARGIGYACAQRILDSGGRVCLWDLDDAAVRHAAAALNAPDRVSIAVVDVSDDTSVQRAAGASQDDMGRVDILINNAGITGPNKTTWEYDQVPVLPKVDDALKIERMVAFGGVARARA